MTNLDDAARVVVLCYHGMNVGGHGYPENDHVAFEADLELLRDAGIPILPLRDVARHIAEGRPLERSGVALTCDDGSWFDWHDLEHPAWGVQKSLRRILAEQLPPGQRHLTSFVIASPEARTELDRTCMLGTGWWGDDWWPQAHAAGIDVQNHSWDHNHSTLVDTVADVAQRGRFDVVTSRSGAEAEIARAGRYISARTGRPADLFAYPYGEFNAYLAEEYLPNQRHEHGQIAAFTTEPRPIDADSDRWTLPRYVCGPDWNQPDGLRALLRDGLGQGLRA